MVGLLWSSLLRDVRYGLRGLRKTPAFTLGAIATVTLSVGATTAIFSVVYGVLLRQLPYLGAEQVFWIWSDQPGRDRTPFNVPDFIDYRDSVRALSGFAGYFAYGANLNDEAAGERVQGLRATGNFFDVLGAHAAAGRLLQSSDERPGSDHVVVLTTPFWTRRFGAQPIVDRPIRLNGERYTVVGVVAAGFATPIRDVEFIVPFAPDQDVRRGARNSVNFIHGVGRLRDNVSATQALENLNGIAERLRERFPVENARKRGVRLVAVIDGIVGAFRTALLTVFAAVAAVLLIACTNLANLMLTRATTRRKDLSLKLALGSSRVAIGREVLVEAVVIAVAGGAVGTLVARGGMNTLIALAPAEFPRLGDVRLDVVVMAFAFGVSLLTGILFGVTPALASARLDVLEGLHDGSGGTTGRRQRLRGALVSTEVALAVVLLTAMTMLAKSFANVQAVAPGFDASRVLSARLTLPSNRFSNRQAIVTFQRALEARLAQASQVTKTGAISLLPLSGLVARVPFTIEGHPIERERVPYAQYRTVTSGYFETAGIPLTRGRFFSDGDTESTRPVAIVNDELVKHWLAGREPIGTRLLVDDNDTGPRPIEIIGVVGNVQQMALDGAATWDIYLTYTQLHPAGVDLAAANMYWIVRTSGDPMSFANGLAKEIRAVDSDVVASQVWPMSRYLGEAIAPRRFSLTLMAAFAFAAFALALTGIYAIVAYSISQRAREIGIRIALGATPSNIRRLMIGHGIRFVSIGLLMGCLVSAGVTRLLSAMLFGITATDLATFIQVTTAVAGASVLACAMPTARIRSTVNERARVNLLSINA